MSISRFGVSLEADMLKMLDNFVKENKYPNRSQAIRKLIEKNLVEKKWQNNDIVAGAVIMLYNHHKGDVTFKSNSIQHDYFNLILSTQHFHLDHDNCLEVVAVKGHAKKLSELADKLIGIKGVKHGDLVMSQTGE
jgi:CopG family transcriptional regulator, nickel-responsive regulator